MKAGLFTSSMQENLSDMLITEFIQNGITVFKISNVSSIVKTILANKLDSIFLDIDNPDIDWMDTVSVIKNGEETKNVHIVVFTVADDPGPLNDFIIEGISGFFHTTDPPMTSYVEKSKKRITFLEEKTHNKRVYARVKPDKDEIIKASLEVSDVIGTFNGKVKNISMVSVAVDFGDNILVNKLEKGQKVNKLLIEFDGIAREANGKIVRIDNGVVVVMFENKEEKFSQELATFVYYKINF